MTLTAKQQTMLEEVPSLMGWEATSIEADGRKLCLSYVKDGASHISEPEGKGAFWARIEGMFTAAQIAAENNPDSNPLVGMAATVVYGKSPDDVMQAIHDMRHHLQGNNILGDARAQTEWVL